MTSTTNRGYDTPAHGSNVDTWDQPLNSNFGIIDSNLGAVSSIALTNVNVTLSSSQYNCGTIRFSGTLTGNVQITFPSVSGWWSIDNLTTGSFYVLLTCGAGNNIAIPQGKVTDILTDSSNVKFRNLGIDIGDYWDSSRASVPAWVTACTVPPFLLCDGSTFSAVTYPYLNSILGGTTLPDARGRNRIPLDGGTGRVTTAGSGIDGVTRFASGGAQNIALSVAELAAHDHGGSTGSSTVGTLTYPIFTDISGASSNDVLAPDGVGAPSTGTVTPTGTHLHSISSAGAGTAHNNMPPTFVGGVTMIRAA